MSAVRGEVTPARDVERVLVALLERERVLVDALAGMVEVFAKPHNETLHEVIAARAALRSTGAQS